MIFRKVLFLFLILINVNYVRAEIIENEKIINRKFDIWNVSCKDDEMLNEISCRLFVEITNDTTLFVNPHNKENKILLISKDGYYNKDFFIKIDDNKLITSQNTGIDKYNIVNFKNEDINNIFDQISKGQTFFIRFTIRDIKSPNGFKEITVKFSLTEFQKALIYYKSQVNKYSLNINKVN